MNRENEVIVVGAGIIGASCAWRLAQAGVRVTVYDRNAPGSGASQAALGVLGFHARPEMPPEVDALCRLSRNYFSEIVDELAAVTGQRLGFRVGGQLSVALNEADLKEVDELYQLNASQGVAVERPTPTEALQLAPGLNPAVLRAVFFPEDAWIDNTALTLATVEAAKREGARFLRGDVKSIVREKKRIAGVMVDGEQAAADWIVLAAGCWSGQIGGIPVTPVKPVRGQALMVSGQPIKRVVMSPRGYLVPKGDGQTMLGATVERGVVEEANTLGGIAEVVEAGLEIAPGLARSEFVGAWAGLRPAGPDDLPLIGPYKEAPKLIAATGHFRHGILLAPITAEMIRAAILGTESPVDIEPFLPDRLR